MSTASGPEAFITEHQIFWLLVKKAFRRDDVSRVYLAIQAAIAYQQATVDVGWLTGAILPEGRLTADATGDLIGADGLAYFHWIYEVELSSAGEADYHHYRFRRRHDSAQVLAHLRTATAPKSLQFQQEYERQRRKLEKKRSELLATYRPRSSEQAKKSNLPDSD